MDIISFITRIRHEVDQKTAFIFMKKYTAMIIALLGWFAIITQFVLMMENRTTFVTEAIVRFFSFFTILTNLLVAIYFSLQFLGSGNKGVLFRSGALTAITVYITVVGLVYQIALRHIWNPTGMQMIVDELLHTIIPVIAILFWLKYEEKEKLQWNKIPGYLLYPLIYLIYILMRGTFSGFYPYPFIDVLQLGWSAVIVNILLLILVFLILFGLFVGVGKILTKYMPKN